MARLSETQIINEMFDEREFYKHQSTEEIIKFIASVREGGCPNVIIQATPDWRITMWSLELRKKCKSIYVELLNKSWDVCMCMKVDDKKIDQAANAIAYVLSEVKNAEDARCIANLVHLKPTN